MAGGFEYVPTIPIKYLPKKHSIGPAAALQNHTFKNVMTDSSSIFENANFFFISPWFKQNKNLSEQLIVALQKFKNLKMKT